MDRLFAAVATHLQTRTQKSAAISRRARLANAPERMTPPRGPTAAQGRVRRVCVHVDEISYVYVAARQRETGFSRGEGGGRAHVNRPAGSRTDSSASTAARRTWPGSRDAEVGEVRGIPGSAEEP